MLTPLNETWDGERLEASEIGPLCCWFWYCWKG